MFEIHFIKDYTYFVCFQHNPRYNYNNTTIIILKASLEWWERPGLTEDLLPLNHTFFHVISNRRSFRHKYKGLPKLVIPKWIFVGVWILILILCRRISCSVRPNNGVHHQQRKRQVSSGEFFIFIRFYIFSKSNSKK